MAKALQARVSLWRWAVALLSAGAVAGAAGTALAADGPAVHRVAPAAHLRPFTVVSPGFQDGGFLPRSAELGGPAGMGVCEGKNLALRRYRLASRGIATPRTGKRLGIPVEEQAPKGPGQHDGGPGVRQPAEQLTTA